MNATQQDNVFYAPVDGLAADGVVYQDTEKYENGNFVTTDYALMQNGFTYEYATGSDLVSAMTVDVTVVKDFIRCALWGRNQECAPFCRSGEQRPNGGCTYGLCFAPV